MSTDLGDSGEQPAPTTRSALWPPRSRAVTSLQCICLHKLHWQEVKLRRSMCDGWKAPSAPCGLGWVPKYCPSSRTLPRTPARPRTSSPQHIPASHSGPMPDPQRGGGAEPGSVSFTPSPPLCGGGWCLSRVTYTDMHFLKDFFFFLVKKQWKNPKSN